MPARATARRSIGAAAAAPGSDWRSAATRCPGRRKAMARTGSTVFASREDEADHRLFDAEAVANGGDVLAQQVQGPAVHRRSEA